jgi:hypothetical protein
MNMLPEELRLESSSTTGRLRQDDEESSLGSNGTGNSSRKRAKQQPLKEALEANGALTRSLLENIEQQQQQTEHHHQELLRRDRRNDIRNAVNQKTNQLGDANNRYNGLFIQQLTTPAIASGLEPLVEEARQNVAQLKGELDKLKEEEIVIMTEQQHTATTPGSSNVRRGGRSK